MTKNKDIDNYKVPINFCIDMQGKIFYNPNDLLDVHEDIIEKYQLDERRVCRLVYDPNLAEDYGFAGILGLHASCNILYDALPFELKKSHLDVIERWLRTYNEIIDFESKNKISDNTFSPLNAVKVQNQIAKLMHKYDDYKTEEELEMEAEEKERQERIKQKLKEEADIEAITSLYSTETTSTRKASGKELYSFKYSVDLAGFLELTYNTIATDTNNICSEYWRIAANIINGLMIKITERAIQIEDKEILECLRRLKMVTIETEEKEVVNG